VVQPRLVLPGRGGDDAGAGVGHHDRPAPSRPRSRVVYDDSEGYELAAPPVRHGEARGLFARPVLVALQPVPPEYFIKSLESKYKGAWKDQELMGQFVDWVNSSGVRGVPSLAPRAEESHEEYRDRLPLKLCCDFNDRCMVWPPCCTGQRRTPRVLGGDRAGWANVHSPNGQGVQARVSESLWRCSGFGDATGSVCAAHRANVVRRHRRSVPWVQLVRRADGPEDKPYGSLSRQLHEFVLRGNRPSGSRS